MQLHHRLTNAWRKNTPCNREGTYVIKIYHMLEFFNIFSQRKDFFYILQKGEIMIEINFYNRTRMEIFFKEKSVLKRH